MSISIRKPVLEDLEAYRDIRLSSLKDYPKAFSSSYEEAINEPVEYYRSYIIDSLNSNGSLMFCAYDGSKIIGSISAYWRDKQKVRHIANIGGMYVRTEYQNRGIATKLFEELFRNLHSMNRFRKIKLEVVLDNPNAYHLYKKLGFIETGTNHEELLIDGEYHDTVLMEKQLTEKL